MSNVPPPPPPPPPPPASVPPPPPPGFSYSSAAGPPRNGLGTASLVLGVLSLIGSVLLLPIVLGVIGLILGIMGRVRASRGEATNGGIAIAGIITSVLGIAAAIALIVFVFVATDIGSLVECLDDAGDNQAEIDRCEQEFQDDFLGG